MSRKTQMEVKTYKTLGTEIAFMIWEKDKSAA
jgi:hypothetical protein